MSALTISNVNPVVLTTSIDSQNQLEVWYGSNALGSYGDSILVKIPVDEQEAPVPVRIEIVDPSASCTLGTVHEDGDGNPVTWSRATNPAKCQYTWGETEQQHEVVITPVAESNPPPPKTIYIEVEADPNLPDPTV